MRRFRAIIYMCFQSFSYLARALATLQLPDRAGRTIRVNIFTRALQRDLARRQLR